jgi:hypothetical protein
MTEPNELTLACEAINPALITHRRAAEDAWTSVWKLARRQPDAEQNAEWWAQLARVYDLCLRALPAKDAQGEFAVRMAVLKDRAQVLSNLRRLR